MWDITLTPPPGDRLIKTDADTQILRPLWVCECVFQSVLLETTWRPAIKALLSQCVLGSTYSTNLSNLSMCKRVCVCVHSCAMHMRVIERERELHHGSMGEFLKGVSYVNHLLINHSNVDMHTPTDCIAQLITGVRSSRMGWY